MVIDTVLAGTPTIKSNIDDLRSDILEQEKIAHENIMLKTKEIIEFGDKHIMNEWKEALIEVSNHFDAKYEATKMRIDNVEQLSKSNSHSLKRTIDAYNSFKHEVEKFYLKWAAFCAIHTLTIGILFYFVLR